MSKKMSMQDMKEVRRIIVNLLTDSIKNVACIKIRFYRLNPSFYETIDYNAFRDYATTLVEQSPEAKEISDLEVLLQKKSNLLIKRLVKPTKEERGDDESMSDDDDVKVRIPDPYEILSKLGNELKNILRNRTEEKAKELADKFNKYLTSIESRTFDAYTKGMSADDFLNIIRDEVKTLQEEAVEFQKELEANGYRADD